MSRSEPIELLGGPLGLDELPHVNRFCSKVGGVAPQAFSSLVPLFQLRFESALGTLDSIISTEEVAEHFAARLRNDKEGKGALGVIGEVTAASIYSAFVAPVSLIPEKDTKDVDFVGEHSDYLTQNEVKLFWDNFGKPPTSSTGNGQEIEWPASIRNITADRTAYERARAENNERDPEHRLNFRHSRASELFDKAVGDVLPKLQAYQVNLLWLYSQNTTRPDFVAAALSKAILTALEQDFEKAKNLSGFVWYTLSEETPIIYFWENPQARVKISDEVASPIRELAERALTKIREENDQKLLEYEKERNEWYAERKRGDRTKFT